MKSRGTRRATTPEALSFQSAATTICKRLIRAQRESVAMPQAASGQFDEIIGEAELLVPPRQGSLNVYDEEKEVVIEMYQSHQVGLVLNTTGGLIRFKVWPRDKRGFWRVTGRIESLNEQGEDHSLDKRNDGEA